MVLALHGENLVGLLKVKGIQVSGIPETTRPHEFLTCSHRYEHTYTHTHHHHQTEYFDIFDRNPLLGVLWPLSPSIKLAFPFP